MMERVRSMEAKVLFCFRAFLYDRKFAYIHIFISKLFMKPLLKKNQFGYNVCVYLCVARTRVDSNNNILRRIITN